LEQSSEVSPGFSLNNLPYVFLQGGGSMKRVFMACLAVVFLFGISSVSVASGDGMKNKGGAMKEEGMKKGDESMGDMKGKGEEMSSEAKSKDMPAKIETKGKEKPAKAKKKPADK
jgi:hypothetical protein